MSTAGIGRIREYCESVVDWTCIERLPLEKFVYFFAIFDFISSMMIFVITSVAHFLYVNPAGKSSFLHYKVVNHVDIYKYRRFQEWELSDAVDWNEDLRYINSTRALLDKKCSRYKYDNPIPGDLGDYIREVVGRPYSSGYNARLSLIIKLWMGTVIIIYLSSPSLLLAIWWRKRRVRIIIVYLCIHIAPIALCISIGAMMDDPLMCAANYAYGRAPMRDYFHTATVIFVIYEAIKFFILILYWIERVLTARRKDVGFPTHKIIKRTVKVVPFLKWQHEEEDGNEADIEDDDVDEEEEELMKKKKRVTLNVPETRVHKSLSGLSRRSTVVLEEHVDI